MLKRFFRENFILQMLKNQIFHGNLVSREFYFENAIQNREVRETFFPRKFFVLRFIEKISVFLIENPSQKY